MEEDITVINLALSKATRAALVRGLENQLKMHDFMTCCDYGSPSHRAYVEGLTGCSSTTSTT